MKAENLKKLRDMQEINIPNFIVVDGPVEKLDLTYLRDDVKYAVRSSCYLEDTEGSSCAGQFKTFLNICKKDIREKVKEVFNSYEGHGGTVIIQEMVDADTSGVIFTANPVGILNEIVIVSGKGLGENVVEDKVDTSTYYYNIDDKIYYTEGDNILTKDNVNKLVDISLKLKQEFKSHIDIEFAKKNDKIYILQVRPITTLDNDTEYIILDNSNIVESYPGISLPMTQYFAKEIYYKVFRRLVLRLTTDTGLVSKMDKQLQDMVDICNGRIYYRITNWYDVLNLLPMSNKIIPIWQDMLGVTNKNIKFNNKVSIKTKAKVLTSVINLVLTSPKRMDKLNLWFKDKLDKYRAKIDNSNTVDELVDTYNSIMTDLTDVWDITLVNDMYTFIFTALSGKKGKEKLASIKDLESMKPVKELNRLVKIYNIQGESIFFIDKEKEYIEQFGDRCLEELKLETKTYRTNPELLRDYIRNADVINIKEDDSKSTKDGFFVKRAKIGIYNREVSRLNRSRIFGMAREIILKIGNKLYKLNKLDNIEDVFYLKVSELTSDINFKSLVKERKQEIEEYKTIPDYSRLEFNGTITNKHRVNTSIIIGNNSNKLTGIASSIGKVSGEVIVINKADTSIDTSNKIIVTTTTDPGWVFLIKNSLGIVAEKGSILSHTAIITRELGKPSIVNIKDVTKILKNGDKIELDAYTGTITILED